ncbi:MAG: FliA/WhiG family RNA polymerase sigma factor [Chloroflexi bacterium]|nr:FliA/WhiG family RNA polymerase sigma factor [Chloroflexota bacterium]
MSVKPYAQPPAIASETDTLWAQFSAERGNRDLRDRLIIAYLPLVKQVVRAVMYRLPAHVDADDLESCGMLGLIEAVERFDRARGVQFQTYATMRIRGRVLDQLRSLDALPREARRRAREIQRAIAELWAALGRAPSDEETAARAGLDMTSYREALADASLAIVSLDDPLAELSDDGGVLGDMVAADADGFDDRLIESEMRAHLVRAVASLPQREKQLIALYYYEELTLKEIGTVLGVTESRTCQMHGKAVLMLRASLAAQEYSV